jgi:hypothetical protein
MTVPWQEQMKYCIIPGTYDQMGMLLSTNRGRFVSQAPLPSGTYMPAGLSNYANNSLWMLKAMRGDGAKAVPVNPIVYLTKGYPGPYNQ